MRARAVAARRRRVAVGACAAVTASLIVAGCSAHRSREPLVCHLGSTAGIGTTAPGAPAARTSNNSGVAPAWSLPGGDLANTRDVASGISSSTLKRLGVAWTVPLHIPISRTDGAYATTPVVAHGVVYVQDLESNVLAIRLATGAVLWEHRYTSPNGGPDGVTLAHGVVYGATNSAAFALSATSGAQLWIRTLTRNDHEGIGMAPGYDHGTVYVSTVPSNATVGQYLPDAKGTLWALDAATGAPMWKWNEVQNLWGKPAINSGGGQWYPPSFDAHGNVYLGIGNPGPVSGTPRYPWGTSRPGPDLYTDAVVKLSAHGTLLWYYQLTPHDIFDWDLQDSPILTTANGHPVVIDGGKAGIVIELDARTGKPLWERPVGIHNGHDHDGVRTENAKPDSHIDLPTQFCVEPGVYGGILSPLATNGTSVFAAVNDLPTPVCATGSGCAVAQRAAAAAVLNATGEMVAIDQDTGALTWDTRLPSSPYGAATVTNDVVFTTTLRGEVYALSARTGAILRTFPLPAGTNAPVAVDGNYVIAGAGIPLTTKQQPMIIAFELGATGTLHTSGNP
jgi:alcohol dehydrogenase (cytochrome c)